MFALAPLPSGPTVIRRKVWLACTIARLAASFPRRTGEALAERVEQLRRQRFTGYHIAQTTGLSRATVSRILRRLGLNRMRDLEPAVPLIRYEHPAPGDLLHLDIKQLGRFAGVVSRPDGRRRGTLHRGWEYVHVAIDDHSRIAFTQILPRFDAACAIAFLRASLAYYASLGIVIRRLLTDNGHCYRSRAFHAAVVELGLRHHFTRPYTTPQRQSRTLHPNRLA
jgi:transposase InsO family protein